MIDQLDAVLRSESPDVGRAQLKLAAIRAKAQQLLEAYGKAEEPSEDCQRQFRELHRRTQQIGKALIASSSDAADRQTKQPRKNSGPR